MQEDIDRFGDVGSLEDNVESFLSNDGGDGRDIYGTIKQSPTELQKESSEGNLSWGYVLDKLEQLFHSTVAILCFPLSGFTFGEVDCIRTRNSKVTCCHFSSDGKLLASAGHDKKV